MRRFLMLLAATAAFVIALGGTALAQQYPPAPTPAEDVVPGVPVEAPAEAPALAVTGDNILLLILIGLAVLIVGIALVTAARRRAEIRRRGVIEAIA